MKPSTSNQASIKVALYGGSFDPVHCAHLQVARAALDQVPLDKVVFIPAARSPLKETRAMASDEARVAMLRLATEEDARFELDTCELERGGTSYTFDTVMAYQKAHPECELYWILGGDQFELLPQWHRIDELAELLTFIVLQRPGYSTTLPAVQGLQYLEVEAPLMPHSSTNIRRAIQAGCLAKDLVPASVEAFIYSHALYTR